MRVHGRGTDQEREGEKREEILQPYIIPMYILYVYNPSVGRRRMGGREAAIVVPVRLCIDCAVAVCAPPRLCFSVCQNGFFRLPRGTQQLSIYLSCLTPTAFFVAAHQLEGGNCVPDYVFNNCNVHYIVRVKRLSLVFPLL